MADKTKYYYLKIKENFFDTEDMKLLESMENGYLYSNILMKMYLLSLKNEGKLVYKDKIPYNSKMLSTVTGHNTDIIEKAIKVFKELELIEVLDSGAIFMLDIQNFIGKSSDEADRKRAYRNRIEDVKKIEMDKCPDKCPTNFANIKDRVKDKDIIKDKDIYIYVQNEQDNFERLWKMYPNKKGKTKAKQSYLKAKKEKVTDEQIEDGIKRYLNYIKFENIELKYVKNGSTWFNQRCWEDDYTIKRKINTDDVAKEIDITDIWR